MNNNQIINPTVSYLYDLVEYYDVNPAKAIELGTRSDGRKPSLPGSKTCDPISDMTYEDIWALSPRSTQEEIFKFYRDQGSWSSFRQVVRHLSLVEYHLQVLGMLNLFPGAHLVEYGCGTAPYTRALLEHLMPGNHLEVSLSDLDCEHFKFGLWRAEKTIRRNGLNVDLHPQQINPNELPTYHKKIDRLIVFEVLEHVPSPVECIKNLHDQMNADCLVVENFIKHGPEEEDDDGPDLKTAREEREAFYDFMKGNFDLLTKGTSLESAPDSTRVWKKR